MNKGGGWWRWQLVRTVLVGDHVVFIFGINRLVVRRNVDVVVRKLVVTEVFEQVRDAPGRQVDVRSGGIFRLLLSVHISHSSGRGWEGVVNTILLDASLLCCMD